MAPPLQPRSAALITGLSATSTANFCAAVAPSRWDNSYAVTSITLVQKAVRPLPSVATLMAGAYSQNEFTLDDLIHKKLTWGDYVKLLEATYNALKPQLMTELQRIGDELDKETPAQ